MKHHAKHACPDCGGSCDDRAKRCIECHLARRRKPPHREHFEEARSLLDELKATLGGIDDAACASELGELLGLLDLADNWLALAHGVVQAVQDAIGHTGAKVEDVTEWELVSGEPRIGPREDWFCDCRRPAPDRIGTVPVLRPSSLELCQVCGKVAPWKGI